MVYRPVSARRAGPLAAALFILILPPPALAADAKNGEALARRSCAVCHVVAEDQDRKPNVAPAFAEIAKKPGFNVERLIEARKPPHPPIPPNLPPEQAADIAAYILTLVK